MPPNRNARRFDNLDASETIYFANALTVVKAGTYDKKFPNLKSRQFIPLDTSIDPNIDVMKVRSYSAVGVATLIASYSDDLPRADVKGEETMVPFVGVGDSYGYSLIEIRKAASNGVQLPTMKANAARRAIEIKIDAILALGDQATGLVGLLNQPNAQTYVVPVGGVSADTEWSGKSGSEILADMIGICELIVTNTNELEKPNMLLLPREQFTLISTQAWSADSETTILQRFKTIYPEVGVDQWAKLKGAGAGGSDRMVAYDMNPDHVQGAVPQEFEQLDPQARNLEFVVPCHARVGGVFLYYPLSMAYGDGI